MVKFCRTVVLFPLLSTLLIPLLATSVSAQAASMPDEQQDLGICGLQNRTSYMVVDETGHTVNIVDYCRAQRDRAEFLSSLFWQNFEAAATAETIAFAKSLGEAEVIAYGVSICPFLERGGTLQELRQVQADQNMPSDFEVAVTLAAIHTYCPAQQAEIGRL